MLVYKEYNNLMQELVRILLRFTSEFNCFKTLCPTNSKIVCQQQCGFHHERLTILLYCKGNTSGTEECSLLRDCILTCFKDFDS